MIDVFNKGSVESQKEIRPQNLVNKMLTRREC